MYVAKSYQGLERAGEPYSRSNRMYVKVILKSGKEKEVRLYNEREYASMYKEKPNPESTPFERTADFDGIDRKEEFYGGQKHALGFDKGYITIFKGDQYPHLEWFRASIARYCTLWGWYVVSTDEVPADLPYGLEPVRLDWDKVGEGFRLKPDKVVEAYVNTLIYPESPSQFQGEIGERIERTIVIRRVIDIENNFGTSKLFIMADENENQYLWCTSAKKWEENEVHKIRGTIKDLSIYRNVKQTVLTRCMEVQ